jgi:hypothetical protein
MDDEILYIHVLWQHDTALLKEGLQNANTQLQVRLQQNNRSQPSLTRYRRGKTSYAKPKTDSWYTTQCTW